MKKIALTVAAAGTMLVSLASFASAENNPSNKVPGFERLTYQQMFDIASVKRLPHRIFYTRSTGPDATWFDAVKQGRLDDVKKMVEAGQNIEAKDEASLGQTALGWAAFIGYMDIAEYLVSKGASLAATDRADVQNTFKSAILGGNIKMIEYLYPLQKKDINLDAQDERDGETALMVAVSNDRVEATRFLIKAGANPNIVSTQLDKDALNYACEGNYQHLVKILNEAGAVNHKTKKPGC